MGSFGAFSRGGWPGGPKAGRARLVWGCRQGFLGLDRPFRIYLPRLNNDNQPKPRLGSSRRKTKWKKLSAGTGWTAENASLRTLANRVGTESPERGGRRRSPVLSTR
jgi:hypothetical protein